jgi:L-asparaginase
MMYTLTAMVGLGGGSSQLERDAPGVADVAGPLVTLIATGGTISTTTDARGRSAPTLTGRDLEGIAGVVGARLVSRDADRRPSWSLTPDDMAMIAVTARDVARESEREEGRGGVVVTHGTTTLEYTAFLADLFLDVDTPVVLTGAMRRADDAKADGPGNLRDAIRVAADPRARGLGALVVFAGRILSGASVWKAHRNDRDAFADLAGDVGRVDATNMAIERTVRRRPIFSGRIDDRVAFVKAVPGAGGELIDAAVATGVRGLTVEAMPGAGGIPPGMVPSLARAATRIPVVVASRAPYGILPAVPTGGTGDPLAGLDLLSAGSLSAEHAFLLLMAALGDGTNDAEVRARFRAAAGDEDPARGG